MRKTKNPAQLRRSFTWNVLITVALFVIIISQLQDGESFWAFLGILGFLGSASSAYSAWRQLNA